MNRHFGSSGAVRSGGRLPQWLLALAALMAGLAWAKEQPAVVKQGAEQAVLDPAAPQVPLDGRQIIHPPGLDMRLDWYSARISSAAGRVNRGWVKKDVILLETDRNVLVCLDRAAGTERWQCELTQACRYEPAVSRNNVVLNINNYLLAINKLTGKVRWRMLPNFVMSTGPLVIDPPAYPKEYTKKWQTTESVYAGSWDGRFYAILVQVRADAVLGKLQPQAPEFTLYHVWHKTHFTKGIPTTRVHNYEDLLYYGADDGRVYAINRDANMLEPYLLQGNPCTDLTLTDTTCYLGSRDFSVYALDRLSLRPRWTYPMGCPANYRIFADAAQEEGAYVYIPSESEGIHAILVRKGEKDPTGGNTESASLAWKAAGAEGVAGTSKDVAYLGFGREKEFPAYQRIKAIDKQTGKLLWEVEPKGSRFYLEFSNNWRREDEELRIFAVTEDNRLLSFKEKMNDAGPVKVAPPPQAEPPVKPPSKKVPGAAQAKPEEAAQAEPPAKTEKPDKAGQ